MNRTAARAALLWFAFIALGGIALPVGVFALTLSAGSGVTLADFTDSGQLGVYSMALLASTWYVLRRPNELLPALEWFIFFAFVLSAGASALIVLGALAGRGEIEANVELLRWSSVIILVLVVIVSFAAVYYDELVATVEPTRTQERAQGNLEEEFEESVNAATSGSIGKATSADEIDPDAIPTPSQGRHD